MKVAIVGHGPSLLKRQRGKDIDAHDVVVRIKRSWQLPEIYPEFYGTRTDIVCGSMTLGEGVIKPWHDKGVRKFWIFVDQRTKDLPTAMEEALHRDYGGVHCDRALCEKWRNRYIDLRWPIERDPQQVMNALLSDEMGHRHQSAGSHAIMYALDVLKPKSISLYGMDSLTSGVFVWSITRGPEYKTYPDHNWRAEKELLLAMATDYGYSIVEKEPQNTLELWNAA